MVQTTKSIARALILVTWIATVAQAEDRLPNFVVIFTDDKCYASGRIVTKPNVSCDKHCISPCLQITENSRKFSSIQGQ